MSNFKPVFKGQFYTVKHGFVKNYKGEKLPSEIVCRPDRVGVFTINIKDQVLLTKEFRPRYEKNIWRFPIGKVDKGCTPLQSAKKELEEEIGYKAKKWNLLIQTDKASGTECRNYYFVAKDITFVGAKPHKDEKIVVKPVSFKKAYQLAMENAFYSFIDSYAVLKLWHERKKWLK